MQSYLKVEKISFKYKNVKIIDDFSFSLNKGEILLINGNSGVGKTTLLRLISGLEEIKNGEIILDSKKITKLKPEKREIGFLFQNFALFPHMTVGDNIQFGLKEKNVDYWLDLVSLKEFKNEYPNNLSGGQKQRVALVRTLANSPKLILLDEPFSSLDANLKKDLRIELRKILKDLNITAIIVSHDEEDESIADRVLRLGK